MVTRTLSLAGMALALVVTSSAAPIMRAAQPDLSPDGSLVAFTWQNDVWTVPAAGGRATRLTVNQANDGNPKFLPGGKRMAFTSNRFGSIDVFTMNVDGTDIRRVTHQSSAEYLTDVSPDGSTLYGYTTAFGRINPFRVPVAGGDLIALNNHPFELSYFPNVHANGRTVVLNIGGSSGNWRNPNENGTDTAEIWTADNVAPLRNYKQLTKNDHNDIFPCWTPDGKVAFISNRTGSPQLWVMNADGNQARQVTRHLGGGTMRWMKVAKNGEAIYEYDSDLYRTNIATGATTKIAIDTPEDTVFNDQTDVRLSAGATSYIGSPDAKRAVLALRGDIFVIPERGGTTRRLTTHVARDYAPVWLNDSSILFVTGRNNKRDLFTVTPAGQERLFLSATLDLTNPLVSPDRKFVGVHHGTGEILIVSAEGGAPIRTIKGTFPGTYQRGPGFSWSADSKWIAYTSDTARGANVMITEIATGKTIQVARAAYGAAGAGFLGNGKGVFYTSDEFGESDIMLVDLVEPTLTFSEDDLDKIGEEPTKPAQTGIVVQERGLEQRVRRLTRGGATGIMSSPDGRAIWANVEGQFSTVPVSGGAIAPVPNVTGPVSGLELGNGKLYLTLAGGRPAILNLQNGQVAPVSFNAEYQVDRKSEEMALFNEIWWAMNRLYYDAAMHGKDWKAIQAEYAARVPHAFDRADFYALMNEMIEEVDSSHLTISAPPSPIELPRETTAWFGVDFDPAALATGTYTVSKVYVGTPADLEQSRLLVGDTILRVNGVAPSAGAPLAALLRNQAGKKVEIQVRRNGATINLLIKPTSDSAANSARYEQFILDRRAEADRLSKGAVAYFHVQGMNQPSTDRFMREIRAIGEGKKASVVDVRWNGGGNTANQMLAAIRLMPWLMRKFRWNPDFPMSEEQFRGNALEMPAALMTNQYSASNAEIFSEGFRQMKIGPVVGEATGGNVLTVAGNYGLWDGGGVQIPFIGVYAMNGESLEGNGRRVDVDVRYDPNLWLEGRDKQLEVAVRELLRKIDK